jgi:pyruvate dehydrogenase E2 component (dihydrolipoamide acetyltransferase)
MSLIEVKVPDIGDYKDVPVIEVLVKPGDAVGKEASLLTLESDKATMEVPSPAAGVVQDVRVKVGDKVSQGTLILMLEAGAEASAAAAPAAPVAPPAAAPAVPTAAPAAPAPAPQPAAPPQPAASPTAALEPVDEAGFRNAHASPSVRRFARELGVDLAKVTGSGPKGRILKDDVQGYVKTELARPRGTGGGMRLRLKSIDMF